MTRNKFILYLSVSFGLFFGWIRLGFYWKKREEKRFLLVSFSVKSFYKLRLEFHDIDDFLFKERSGLRVKECKFCLEFLCVHPRVECEREKWHFVAAAPDVGRDAPCQIRRGERDRIDATISLFFKPFQVVSRRNARKSFIKKSK